MSGSPVYASRYLADAASGAHSPSGRPFRLSDRAMTRESINAYDLPDRVLSYDADMAIMHPNRTKT